MSRNGAVFGYVQEHGGNVGATVKGVERDYPIVISSDNNTLRYIAHDGTSHSCPSDLIEHLEQFVALRANGSNTEGGNAANNVLGNYNIYGHIILDSGVSLAEVVGLDNSNITFNPHKPRTSTVNKFLNQPANTHMVEASKDPQVFMKCATQFGKETVIHDRKLLTVGEFAMRYGIELAN